MREHDGQTFLTIGEVAAEVGVSPQTLRVWEAQDLLVPDRSKGAQRLYSQEHLERARQVAELRRGQGWNPAAIRTALGGSATELRTGEGTAARWDGATIRKARRERGLTVKQAAGRIGISPSFLSSVERGETGVSTQIVARIADAFLIPMSGLARFRAHDTKVVRSDERARGLFSGGVVWEELAAPGHSLEPAMLTVPPGESSGGAYSRPGEAFTLVLVGELRFTVGREQILLGQGDSIVLPPATAYAWENPGETPAQAVWVEQLALQAAAASAPEA